MFKNSEFEYELDEVIRIKSTRDLREYTEKLVKEVLVRERVVPADIEVVIPVGADSWEVSPQKILYYEADFECFKEPHETTFLALL